MCDFASMGTALMSAGVACVIVTILVATPQVPTILVVALLVVAFYLCCLLLSRFVERFETELV